MVSSAWWGETDWLCYRTYIRAPINLRRSYSVDAGFAFGKIILRRPSGGLNFTRSLSPSLSYTYTHNIKHFNSTPSCSNETYMEIMFSLWKRVPLGISHWITITEVIFNLICVLTLFIAPAGILKYNSWWLLLELCVAVIGLGGV